MDMTHQGFELILFPTHRRMGMLSDGGKVMEVPALGVCFLIR